MRGTLRRSSGRCCCWQQPGRELHCKAHREVRGLKRLRAPAVERDGKRGTHRWVVARVAVTVEDASANAILIQG